MAKQIKGKPEEETGKPKVYGDPDYTAGDDIYSREKKEPLEDPDPKIKLRGMDVPGAELDDADEAVGEEDEENNYYSLGGEDHEDLEEDKGD